MQLGFSPLHMAAANDHISVAKILTDAGASPDSCTNNGLPVSACGDVKNPNMPWYVAPPRKKKELVLARQPSFRPALANISFTFQALAWGKTQLLGESTYPEHPPSMAPVALSVHCEHSRMWAHRPRHVFWPCPSERASAVRAEVEHGHCH